MFLAPFRAVGDLPFYRQVSKSPVRWMFGYLAYLGLLFAVAAVVSLWLRVSPALRETVEWAASSVPPITFSAGKVSSAAPGPVRLRHPRMEGFSLVVDTARVTPVTLAEMQEQKAMAYLTQSILYIAPRPDKVEAYDLSRAIGAPEQPVVLDANFYRAVGDALPKVLLPLTFFLSWAIFVAWKLCASLVYSVLALIINAAMKGGLPWEELWRLSVVAQTPVVLLQMAQMFLPAPIPLFGLIALIVIGVYLWQGIRHSAPAGEPAASPTTPA